MSVVVAHSWRTASPFAIAKDVCFWAMAKDRGYRRVTSLRNRGGVKSQRRWGERCDGNEVRSGKLASLESFAALAVNTFGWFIERPERLPPIPGLYSPWPPIVVEVEYCARFPWAGGRHP